LIPAVRKDPAKTSGYRGGGSRPAPYISPTIGPEAARIGVA
jgi:hypothetical protein